MNICKKTDKVLTELYLKKKTADRQWDRVFRDALHGNLNQAEMALAMDHCNTADYNLIEFEKINTKLNKGKKGYGDEDFYRLYIEPYSKSRA